MRADYESHKDGEAGTEGDVQEREGVNEKDEDDERTDGREGHLDLAYDKGDVDGGSDEE